MSDLTLDKALQRGDKNGQIKLIQEWLSLHGEHVGIDGDFGPATQSAVKDFQNKTGLAATGIIDANTFERLVAPMKAALQPIPSNGQSLGALVVAYAQQHLAQHPHEVGGQNKGPWVRLYMDGHEGTPWAWCAGFTCFCLKKACDTLGTQMPIKASFSCDELVASAKQHGRFVEHDKTGPGSFFLVRKSSTDWTHTGIIVSTAGETFRTIEGNTNDDGSREGYEVCARTRAYGKTDFILI
jgi:hypothetical protein